MALNSPKEAAAELGDISEGTLANWRVQGKGPEYLKIGSLVRYTDEALAAYKEQARRRSTSEAPEAA
jgi:hypothetical protein